MLRILSLAVVSALITFAASAQEVTPPAAEEAKAAAENDAVETASKTADAGSEAAMAAEPAVASEGAAAGPAEAEAAIAANEAAAGATETTPDESSLKALPPETALRQLLEADPADVDPAAATTTEAAEGAAPAALASASDDLNAAVLSTLKSERAPAAEAAPATAAIAPATIEVERRIVQNEEGVEREQQLVTLTAPDGTRTVLEGVAAEAALAAARAKVEATEAGEAGKKAIKLEVRLEKQAGAESVEIKATGAQVTQTKSEDGKTSEILVSGEGGEAVRITITPP
jgi:hypothetical protein